MQVTPVPWPLPGDPHGRLRWNSVYSEGFWEGMRRYEMDVDDVLPLSSYCAALSP